MNFFMFSQVSRSTFELRSILLGRGFSAFATFLATLALPSLLMILKATDQNWSIFSVPKTARLTSEGNVA